MKVLLKVFLCLLIVFCCQLGFSKTEQSKVYIVTMEGTGYYEVESLENVKMLGIPCIKAKYIDRSWMAGLTIYIPVEKVKAIFEFNSLNEYFEYEKKRASKQS